MLTIIGLKQKDERLFRKYCHFVLARFVTNSALRKTSIIIKIVDPKSLENKIERKELQEVSAWMTYNGLTEDGKRKFLIVLDSTAINKTAKKGITKFKNLLKYLGHELIHIKQYINNEIFDYSDGKTVRFLGGRYSSSEDLINWDYWDAPFEIEAYGRMEGLYFMFLALLKDESKAKKKRT